MDDLHADMEIKPELNSRVSVGKEEDQKPFHQLFKLQIKYSTSTKDSASMEYMRV